MRDADIDLSDVLLYYITLRKFPNWGKVREPAVQDTNG